jgi:hypothetical protein
VDHVMADKPSVTGDSIVSALTNIIGRALNTKV